MYGVAIIGAGMTHFGKFLERSLKDLAREAIDSAIKDAGIEKKQIQAAYVGNAMAGIVTGQECIRGQVMLRAYGIDEIPVINVENACASSSTAFHLAWMSIASGMYDIALALGVEKLYHEDKRVSFKALGSAVDVEMMASIKNSLESMKSGEGAGEKRSLFMDFYAMLARMHMELYGTKKEHFAKIAEKNHYHGSLNPHAQYREVYSLEEIMNSPTVAEPLTRLMCSPIGDGASAVILCNANIAHKFTSNPVYVAASVVVSGKDRNFDEPDIVERGVKKAYEMASIGPEELDLAEVHDATSAAELIAYEEIGLCPKGEGAKLVEDGDTKLGGRIPVNTSGGLVSKGHPVGATGTAQITEVVWQLRGEAGKRQVENARLGLTQNGGGAIGNEAAVMSIHILKR